jgi:hypothetical protein
MSVVLTSFGACRGHALFGSTGLRWFFRLDYQADYEGRETGQYHEEGSDLKCADLAACPAMAVSEPADVHGGVYDQQAGCLPPETGPSMQDASEVQDEHGHDQEPGARAHECPKLHGHLASLPNNASSLASVTATILPVHLTFANRALTKSTRQSARS